MIKKKEKNDKKIQNLKIHEKKFRKKIKKFKYKSDRDLKTRNGNTAQQNKINCTLQLNLHNIMYFYNNIFTYLSSLGNQPIIVA